MSRISIIFLLIVTTYESHGNNFCGLNNAGVIIQKLNDIPLSSSLGLYYDEEVDRIYFFEKNKPALCYICGKTADLRCIEIPDLEQISAIMAIKKKKNGMMALDGNSLVNLIFTRNPDGDITKITTQKVKSVVKDSKYSITGATVDKKGRIIIDVADEKDKRAKGKILEVEKNYTIHEIMSEDCPAGAAFSPDGSKLYQVDSTLNSILRYDYKLRTGKVGKPKVVFNLTEEAYIDGCVCSVTVTKKNELWIGVCGTGTLINYNPRLKTYKQIHKVPTMDPKSLAMGGKDMSTLFVGSDRNPQEDTPAAGSIFAISGTRTVGECSFKLQM